MEEVKRCNNCGKEKSLSCFHKTKHSKDGHKGDCKECRNKENRDRWNSQPLEVRQEKAKIMALKRPVESKRAATRKWYFNNLEKIKEYRHNYNKINREKLVAHNKEWLANNPDKSKEYQKRHGAKNARRWRERNKDKVNAQSMLRYARKCNATPAWLTKEQHAQINEFYRQRKTLSEFHESVFEVDHIEPLKGPTSCGLHVPWNLRVIPSHENRIKYNKLT